MSIECWIFGFGSEYEIIYQTRICAAEMAVRYAALCACRKVHTWRCWPI